jgi:hypothetical protein
MECDYILAMRDPWPAAKGLLDKHRGASAATETALSIVTMVDSLGAADSADMAWFAVAAALRPFDRDEIGADSLSKRRRWTLSRWISQSSATYRN